jgi:L-lactate dehydrogenase (cytochrome)
MLALGADATMLGRSYIYALAAKGQSGVENLIDLYEKEMRVAMTLCGANKLSDLSRDSLVNLK